MKNNFVYKFLALSLCFALLFSLCACGKEKEESAQTAPVFEFPSYTRQALEAPGDGLGIMNGFMAGNSAIVVATDEQRNGKIMRMDCSDFSYASIEGLPFDNFSLADGRPDGSALICGYDENGVLTAAEIGADNSVSLSPLLIPEELGDAFVTELKALGNGYAIVCYFGEGQALCIADKQGKLLGKAEYPADSSVNLSRLSDGSLAVSYIQGSTTTVQLLKADMSVDREYEFNAMVSKIVDGCSPDELLMILNNGQICSAELETEALYGYANPGSIGFSPNILPLDGSRFIGLRKGETILFTRGSGEEQTTLRLSTMADSYFGYSELTKAVADFNAANDRYLVALVDYSAYGDRAQEQLRADIAAGNTPDIYDVNVLSPSITWSGGLFEELSPYYAADSEISYEDIVPSVRKLLERDGKVFEVCPEFNLYSMFAPTELPLEGHMTPEELTRLAQELGAERLFGKSITRYDFLDILLAYSGNDYIDTQNGECHFDDESFVSLLDFAKCLPEEKPAHLTHEYVYAGENLLLIPINTGDLIEDIRMIDACYGGNYKNVGFPSKTGNGVAMSGTVRLAMSASSEYKDGVWEFFRYLLGEDYQRSTSTCPVNAGALERRLSANIGAKLNQNLGVFPVNGDIAPISVPLPDPTEAHKALALELVNSVDVLRQLDPTLLDMVENEAARFFAGAIPAEEAAMNIQSKAQIYLAEQFG